MENHNVAVNRDGRDPLDSEEDVAELADMMAANEALGHPVRTAEDADQWQQLKLAARRKRLGQ